jgi:glyoxylase-like metal-dependent hydrolase (beta-lactamase superfamily II)
MQFGDYRIEIVPDTEFRLDGGAMFGIVPRVLWERRCPPDEKNRIRLNANCLFIDTGSEKILVETGMGEKWSAKEASMYGITRERPFAESLFQITGCGPDDITIVVNTHLHFDHAGGNTIVAGASDKLQFVGNSQATPGRSDEESVENNGSDLPGSPHHSSPVIHHSVSPQFPNARYFVSEDELRRAQDPIERDRASYLKENWEPVIESGQLETKPSDYEVVEGLMMTTVRGHSATMQTLRLDRGGKTLYGFADLIPTTAHLPLPWIMGYDLYPVETLEAKRSLLKQAIDEERICLFYHDPDRPLCEVIEGEKGAEARAI